MIEEKKKTSLLPLGREFIDKKVTKLLRYTMLQVPDRADT